MSLDNDTATLLADQLDRLFAQKVDAKLLSFTTKVRSEVDILSKKVRWAAIKDIEYT